MEKIYDASQLSRKATYQIDGAKYTYVGECPYARANSPKSRFRPLPGQRKTATIKIARSQIGKVYECMETGG